MKPSVKAVAALMFLLVLLTSGVPAVSAQAAQNASQTSAPQQPTSGTATPAQAVPPAGNQSGAGVAVPGMPQSATAPETQSLHIQVGRSVVINVQSRMKRILVSNQNVLETVTVNPTQLAVSAKAPGSSSLVIWDESGHARILDVYADVDVSGLRDALAQAFPNDQIQVEADQGRVVLAGKVSSKAVSDEAVKLAGTYGNNVVNSMVVAAPPRSKQVMLKVRFAEVNRAKLSQFGFNIFSTGAANTIGTVTTQQFGNFGQQQINDVTGPSGRFQTQETIGDVLNLFVFRPDIHLGTVIRALQQKNVLEILAEPNLMARSGEPAKFLAGGEFPFPVVQSAGANAAGTAITIQFRPFGVRLEFTGTITEENVVRLKIAPEVSALDFSNALQVSGFTVPAISTRRAETEVELRDGQSFGIAGLLDQRTTSQMERIPGIGDIPILGQLFRSKQTNKSATELLVLVTPTIVDPLSGNTTAPKQPEMPIEHLDIKDFDKGVTKTPTAEKPSK
jgi:pilus assembly protein CpaC